MFAKTNKENDNVSESISQRNNRAQATENGKMEDVAVGLRERIKASERDAQENSGTLSWQQKRELEQRTAEAYAKENGLWIPINKISSWQPLLSGNENDVYLNTEDGNVYKVNNLMNSKNILSLLERIKLHNQLFPESAYTFVGFTGFDNSSIYPILKQEYVHESTFATPEEIDGHMRALGFEQTGEAEYCNGDIIVSDLYPRNVLKDTEGDIYVIDVELEKKNGIFTKTDEENDNDPRTTDKE